jgi:hypothetical protein
MLVKTDLRVRPVEAARDISYMPTAGVTPNNVQDAIEAVQANVVAAALVPAAIVPTAVNFAMSPYTILPTDYLLEVDTTGGVVVLQTQAAASRANHPFTVKDINGNFIVNRCDVVRTGAELIDGLATYPMDSAYDAKTFKPKLAGDGYEVES